MSGLKKVKKAIKPVYNTGKYIRYKTQGILAKHHVYLKGNIKKLASYQDKHKGERVFLIGTGPSLKAEDLELLKDEYSIGCNMVYKIYSQTSWRPTYHCVTDRNYGIRLSEELSQKVTVPFFVPKSTYVRMKQHPQNSIWISDIYDQDIYEVTGDMLSYCRVQGTVMGFMIELAIFMGFEEIYLLGVDCTSSFQAKGHFVKDYVPENLNKENEQRLKEDGNLTKEQAAAKSIDRSIAAYEIIQEFVTRTKKAKVYNATRGGALEVFPRVCLDDVLGKGEKL